MTGVEPWSVDTSLQRFHHRLEAYASLHRRLEAPLPPLAPRRDMVRNYVSRQLLANAIRKARPDARRGDIFTPDVALAFRSILAGALTGRDVDAFLRELQWDHPPASQLEIVVNEPLPEDSTHEVPVVLLHALPTLPEDVEYRIVGRTLLLWDIHADLVVDFLPNAFGAETT